MDGHAGQICAFDPSDGLSWGVWSRLEILLVGILRDMTQVLQVQGVFVSRDQMRTFVIQDTLRDPTEHTFFWRRGGEVQIGESDSRDIKTVTANTSTSRTWIQRTGRHSAKPTLCVFKCGKLNRPSKEEVKVVDQRHLILANHTVGYATTPSTSHAAWWEKTDYDRNGNPHVSSSSHIIKIW